MLKPLLEMLRPGDTLGLTLARQKDGTFIVTVMPKMFTTDGEHGADRKALNTPLQVTGTLEEIDSPEFATTIAGFTESATALRHTLDEAKTVHKAAADSKTASASKPAAKSEAKSAKAKEVAEEVEGPASAEEAVPELM
jgi:PRTRC genetic system protein E